MKLLNFFRSLFKRTDEVTKPKKSSKSTSPKRMDQSSPSSKARNAKYAPKTTTRPTAVDNGKVLKGKLKYFNKSKGYGFIESKAMQDRIFVHISDLQNHTKVGTLVEFQLISNEKGYQAKQVKKIRRPQPVKK